MGIYLFALYLMGCAVNALIVIMLWGDIRGDHSRAAAVTAVPLSFASWIYVLLEMAVYLLMKERGSNEGDSWGV